MPKKRIEPRGLNRKIAKILGLKDTYISAVLNGKSFGQKNNTDSRRQRAGTTRSRYQSKGCKKSRQVKITTKCLKKQKQNNSQTKNNSIMQD
jgi:hypothetical protein